MSAPSQISRSACRRAESGERNRPPSENESGVMLTIPISKGLPSTTVMTLFAGIAYASGITMKNAKLQGLASFGSTGAPLQTRVEKPAGFRRPMPKSKAPLRPRHCPWVVAAGIG